MARVFAGGLALMASVAKFGASKTEATRVKTTPAILRPLPVSPAMRKFLGVPEISRSGALKKVWDHIKANNLQDASNKKVICCDEKLKSIFDGKEKVGFLEIAKLLSNHFPKVGN